MANSIPVTASPRVSAPLLKLRLLLLFVATITATASAKSSPQADGGKMHEFNIYGTAVNSTTGLGTLGDTIRIELLTPDSTLIESRLAPGVYMENNDPSSVRHRFRFNQLKTHGNRFILRLSNPDYETVCYDIAPSTIDFNAGQLGIRKLTRFEKSLMLGEVTVTASVVAFVNKGDTVQYNADAFQLAQGSMLDALLDQMPGVELHDDGRIYVNGRFVDKLLLDGKDFFKGNQLVLLQNLPAYTVKNIKVYEKAEGATAVLGKGAMDLTNRDKYVMDVQLKKGYNTGWLANAEAGGGTHRRYRGRAFGLGYTDRVRVGTYGFINNLNETRNPDRSGEWTPANSTNGLTSSKGGGIDYGVYRRDNSMELNGSVQATYTHTDNDILLNRQNFLSGGDTYTRRRTDGMRRNLDITTAHSIILRPSQGNGYEHRIDLNAEYSRKRNRQLLTEGTFNRAPGAATDLMDQLNDSLPVGMGAVNRYLNSLITRGKQLTLSWEQFSTIAIPGTSNGISLRSDGFYIRGDNSNDDDYLLQYAGSDSDRRIRYNPKDNHKYKYWVGLTGNFRLNSHLYLSPFYAFSHMYSYNSDIWETEETMPDVNPSMQREMLLRLDPANSFTSGYSHTHHFLSTIFSYENETTVDGARNSTLSVYVQPGMDVVRRRLYFHGITDQTVTKNYVVPECAFYVNGFMPGMAPYLYAEYNVVGNDVDPIHMIDVTFDSDPLNPRMGNPDLSAGAQHTFNLGYQSKKWLGGRLLIDAKLTYSFSHNALTSGIAYDRATGVRIHKIFNVNGERWGQIHLQTNLSLDRTTRTRRIIWRNELRIRPSRYIDVVSYDGFATINRSSVNVMEAYDKMRLQYGIGRYTQLGLEAMFNSRHAHSGRSDFQNFTICDFSYGPTARTRLPGDIEISTGIRMYSTRGYEDPAMNTDQLVWNGRVSKAFFGGSLMVLLDGYDILGKVKSIRYSINAYERSETWTASIPSYVMLSLRWNFAKKPRE